MRPSSGDGCHICSAGDVYPPGTRSPPHDTGRRFPGRLTSERSCTPSTFASCIGAPPPLHPALPPLHLRVQERPPLFLLVPYLLFGCSASALLPPGGNTIASSRRSRFAGAPPVRQSLPCHPPQCLWVLTLLLPSCRDMVVQLPRVSTPLLISSVMLADLGHHSILHEPLVHLFAGCSWPR